MAFLLDHVDQATLDTQRRVVDDERREKVENAPYGHVPGFISSRLFPAGHPYRLSLTNRATSRAPLSST